MDSEFGISARDVEAAEAETVRRLAADRAADRAAELLDYKVASLDTQCIDSVLRVGDTYLG